MDKHTPAVSVIIPNYNKEQYIERAVDSVLNQTYRNIEIIIVDDASTDRSRDIIHRLMSSNDNVKGIFIDSNQGVSKSRNTGIDNAQGKFITTLDSDDIYYPEKIEKEVFILENNHEVVAAFSNYRKIGKNEEIIADICLPQQTDYHYMFHRKGILPRDLMYSKNSYLGEIRYLENLNLYEDWAFKLKIARHGALMNTNSYGIGYRQVGDGLSRRSKREHIKTIVQILREEQYDSGQSYKPLSTIMVLWNMLFDNGIAKIQKLIHERFGNN
jgi:glycosyltransferase involved in cell wall biosynthesis